MRTELLFAATSSAELLVSAEDGCIVRYTTDGSNPTEDTAKTLAENTLTIPAPQENATVTIKTVATKGNVSSPITETTISFVATPDISGTQVYEGTANCPGAVGKPYDVSVKVTVVNGKIKSVDDNGTSPSDTRDSMYWKKLFPKNKPSAISPKLSGKTLTEIFTAKTTPGNTAYNTDAVSGATISSNSVKYAIIDAIQSAPISSSEQSVLAPTINPEWGTVTDAQNAGLKVSIVSDSETTVRYTTDGTDPTEESEIAPFSETYYGFSENGTQMQHRYAAFDADGNRSKVIPLWLTFVNPNPIWNTGKYEGQAHGIGATIDISFAYYSNENYLIKSIMLDETAQVAYEEFLPELLSQIYFAQSTEDITLPTGHEENAQKILDAINDALKDATKETRDIEQ